MTRAQENRAAFEGIFIGTGETRQPMTPPPAVQASTKLIREVADLLDLPVDDEKAREAADWFALKLDRFSMLTARPVFEMDGQGPTCSNCSMIWPLCGCFHYSTEANDTEEGPEE